MKIIHPIPAQRKEPQNVGSNLEKPTILKVDKTQYNMGKLDVRHFLDIYETRKLMQEDGITNPPEEIKKFVREFVEKLHTYSLDEEIVLKDSTFYDSKGQFIMKIPVL